MADSSQLLTLWRISTYQNLDGEGAFWAGGRWNSPGRHVVYLAESVAGAMLEILVHLPLDEEVPDAYRLLRVEAPGTLQVITLDPGLVEDWENNMEATRLLGDAWLEAQQAPLARVPSAIIPCTWNYLLNPRYPEALHVRIVEVMDRLYEPRLLRVRTP